MANIQELKNQEMEIEDLVADRNWSQDITAQEGLATKSDTQSSDKNKEQPCNVCSLKLRSKFKSRRYCLWSTKAVVLILAWNLIISFGLVSFLDPSLYSRAFLTKNNIDTYSHVDLIALGVSYGISAFLHLFYPLAGWLADVRWGRYITVLNSLYFTFWSMIIMITMLAMAVIAFIPLFIFVSEYYYLPFSILQIATFVVVSVAFGLPLLSGVILLICSLITFSANVIQFGIDQLRDAPTDDSVLYIYWYVWTGYVGSLIIRIPFAAISSGYQ